MSIFFDDMDYSLEKHKKHIVEFGTDIPEVENFKWNLKNTK